MYLKFDSEKGKEMLINAYSKLNKESLKARIGHPVQRLYYTAAIRACEGTVDHNNSLC